MGLTLVDFCVGCGKKFTVLKDGNYTKKGTPLCDIHLLNFVEIEAELEESEGED